MDKKLNIMLFSIFLLFFISKFSFPRHQMPTFCQRPLADDKDALSTH